MMKKVRYYENDACIKFLISHLSFRDMQAKDKYYEDKIFRNFMDSSTGK